MRDLDKIVMSPSDLSHLYEKKRVSSNERQRDTLEFLLIVVCIDRVRLEDQWTSRSRRTSVFDKYRDDIFTLNMTSKTYVLKHNYMSIISDLYKVRGMLCNS